MKKTLLSYFLFSILVISLSSCFQVKQVEVKNVESVKMLSMTDSTADIALDLKVYNPNNLKIQVKACELDAFLNKKCIGKVCIPEKITLAKKSENVYTVLLKADMIQVKKLAPSLLFSSKALVNLKGNVQVKAAGINKKIAVDVDKKISKKDLKGLNLAASAE